MDGGFGPGRHPANAGIQFVFANIDTNVNCGSTGNIFEKTEGNILDGSSFVGSGYELRKVNLGMRTR